MNMNCPVPSRVSVPLLLMCPAHLSTFLSFQGSEGVNGRPRTTPQRCVVDASSTGLTAPKCSCRHDHCFTNDWESRTCECDSISLCSTTSIYIYIRFEFTWISIFLESHVFDYWQNTVQCKAVSCNELSHAMKQIQHEFLMYSWSSCEDHEAI